MLRCSGEPVSRRPNILTDQHATYDGYEVPGQAADGMGHRTTVPLDRSLDGARGHMASTFTANGVQRAEAYFPHPEPTQPTHSQEADIRSRPLPAEPIATLDPGRDDSAPTGQPGAPSVDPTTVGGTQPPGATSGQPPGDSRQRLRHRRRRRVMRWLQRRLHHPLPWSAFRRHSSREARDAMIEAERLHL